MSGKWNGIAALEIGAGGAGGNLDLTSPSADHEGNGITTSALTANSTLAIMKCVYVFRDVTTARWQLADADAASSGGRVMLGVTLEAGVTDTAVEVLLQGILRDDTWNWSPNEELYVSTTAGEITATAPTATGDTVRCIGYALSADTIYFDPSTTWFELE